MVKYSIIVFGLILCIGCKRTGDDNALPVTPPAQTQDDTTNLINYTKDITIVNWNIEWFGDATMFNGNLDVQEANVIKILKYLHADLYGICEVVDTARFGKTIRTSLGNDFRYAIIPLNVSQKLAFVYDRNIFRKVSFRPFMGLSSTAYGNFANGRFPYLMTADVVVNGQRNTIHFILLHAKANADADGYNRRLNAAVEMKDSMDLYFGNKNFMLLGDFNDHLNGSILAGKNSPYLNFINDSLHYNAVSLPLNTNGYQSTIDYPNSVIDQQVVSRNITKWYVPHSVRIRTDVSNAVPDYNTHNTSDHYPVSSEYHIVN